MSQYSVECMFTKKGGRTTANERNLHGHQRHHPTSCSWRVSLRSQILLSLKGIWVAEVCLLSHRVKGIWVAGCAQGKTAGGPRRN